MFKPRKTLQPPAPGRRRTGRTFGSGRFRAGVVVGLAFLAVVSSALAGSGATAPRIPWAVPTIPMGHSPGSEAVNESTHTLYVVNSDSGDISVVDSRRCNAQNASQCRPVATLTDPGAESFAPYPATDTLYVFTAHGLEIFDASTCNATDTSGCSQTPTTLPDVLGGGTLDAAHHTLYLGNANDGPVSFIDAASCNATDTSGCGDTPVQTATDGDSIAIDQANHSVYVSDFNDQLLRVFDGATCNATDSSGCGQTPASISLPAPPAQAPAVDEANGTIYVPILSYEPNHPGAVALVDGATCNGTVSSGCATTSLVSAGIVGPQNAIVDPATNTVYIANQGASSISVLDGATCNAHTPNVCPAHPPALAAGFDPGDIQVDPQTHTIYESSQALNDVWVLNAATCNAIKTSGCTRFAPTTTTDDGPSGVVADPATHTVYANDREANRISVIDTSICNAHNVSGCGTAWPEITVGNSPHASALNPLTHTLYVNNRDDNTLSLIDTARCNATVTSGCGDVPPTTAVGDTPQQEAVDEATDTVYVANGDDNTVSVVNGAACNAGDTSGCGQTWPTVAVGGNPTALGLDPRTNTIYVANADDDTVSVIDGSTCNGTDTSGCGQVAATIAVGSMPLSVGIDPSTDTIFVGDRNDGLVSVIDGSTCNGRDTSGCGSTPFALGVGTPNWERSEGRSIAFDPTTQQLFVPVIGDSDVAVIDGNTCRGSNPSGCTVKVVPLRMGGFGTFAAVDTSSGTVYVGNNDDGDFSLFPTRG